MWDLPRPGLQPVSPALAGRFSTTAPPGKPLINEFGKVAVYKINAEKSLTLLYTNDEKAEREIKETLTFTTATKRIKYLGINLPKETKDLYAENYKTLIK